MAAPYLSKKTAQKLRTANFPQELEAGDYNWEGRDLVEVLNPADHADVLRVPTIGAFKKVLGCEDPKRDGDVYVATVGDKTATGSTAVEAMANLFLGDTAVEEEEEKAEKTE